MWEWLTSNTTYVWVIAVGLFTFGIAGTRVLKYRERKQAEREEQKETIDEYKLRGVRDKS
ncbi:MAG: hypothetical protein FWH16_02750 [Oscillospiraceae bacterium]|nr:hypothetical protein [Oscillospiraceae bacterium]